VINIAIKPGKDKKNCHNLTVYWLKGNKKAARITGRLAWVIYRQEWR
jgi:hypothetical protein